VSATFSIVYPTQHRPEFIRHALRILSAQGNDNFEVVVSDNYLEPSLSCDQICQESGLRNLRYVRPPEPLGMVANWEYALQFATGEYVCYLTDKMFVLPGALTHIAGMIEAAGRPEIVTWTSDSYGPETYEDYFGRGLYTRVPSSFGSEPYRRFSPAEDLDRRGAAEVSRPEQRPSDYCRGKVVFGAYRRELVERIAGRYGALFHNISPDYTSMVLALAEARDAIELAASCVVSLNTDISNGILADTSDVAALGFLRSLDGGPDRILPKLLVPGLYVSNHNLVAHDFLTLRETFNLKFSFNPTNWLVYCMEDVYRPSRRWSSATVEAQQKGVLDAFIESLDPELADEARARFAARAAPGWRRRLLRRRWIRGWLNRSLQQLRPARAGSIEAAVHRVAVGRRWVNPPSRFAGAP
jgi:hypothetical protein